MENIYTESPRCADGTVTNARRIVDSTRSMLNAVLMTTKKNRVRSKKNASVHTDKLSVTLVMRLDAQFDSYSSTQNLPIASERWRIGREKERARLRERNCQITDNNSTPVIFSIEERLYKRGIRGIKREGSHPMRLSCPRMVIFSPDGINPVRDEITWTRLMCSCVKKRCKQSDRSRCS